MRERIREILKETFVQEEDFVLVVKARTKLYHGSGEDFDPDRLGVGGYDKILWTVDDPIIARSYIPVSGASILISTDHIRQPTESKDVQQLQRMLGIDYDYSKVKWERHNAVSYPPAPVFEKLFPRNDYKVKDKDYKGDLFEFTDTQKRDSDINAYINERLREMVYKPMDKSSYRNNLSWRIRIHRGRVLKGNERSQGRLFIIHPKEDLRILDMTMGGKIESDLMNPDYHRHDWFQKAKEEGYDGIRINDFAQFDSEGNVGHRSIGFFTETLPKLSWTVQEGVSHPKDLREVVSLMTEEADKAEMERKLERLRKLLERIHPVEVWLYYSNSGCLILSSLVVEKEFRNTGVGSKVMQEIVDFADQNGLIIGATPSSDLGGSKRRVEEFNKKFGFVYNRGRNKSFKIRETMIRYPQ